MNLASKTSPDPATEGHGIQPIAGCRAARCTSAIRQPALALVPAPLRRFLGHAKPNNQVPIEALVATARAVALPTVATQPATISGYISWIYILNTVDRRASPIQVSGSNAPYRSSVAGQVSPCTRCEEVYVSGRGDQ